MNTFTYRARGGDENQAQICKGPLDKPAFIVDYFDGMLSSVTISSVNVSALNSANASATATVVGTTAISGTIVSVQLLTCGTTGTQAAIDGSRFKVSSAATCSNGEILNFDTFILIQAATYDPLGT